MQWLGCREKKREQEPQPGVMMEALEDRRLLSAGVGTAKANNSGLLVQNIGQNPVVTTAAVANLVGNNYEGSLLVTRSVATRLVGGLGAGTVPAGSVLPVRLQFTGLNTDGRLLGQLAVQGLGLAGPVGAFNVVGSTRGKKLTLVLNDNGVGVGRVSGTVTKFGRFITAKFTSKLSGDRTEGELDLRRHRPSEFEVLFGFHNIGGGFDNAVVTNGNQSIFNTGSNGLFVTFNTDHLF
jgi:hypothetical protein